MNYNSFIKNKIEIFNRILSSTNNELFNCSFIDFSNSLQSENYLEFFVIKNNEKEIKIIFSEDDITISIGFIAEALIFDNEQLKDNASLQIIFNVIYGYIILIEYFSKEKVLTIFDKTHKVIFLNKYKTMSLFSNNKIRIIKLLTPIYNTEVLNL